MRRTLVVAAAAALLAAGICSADAVRHRPLEATGYAMTGSATPSDVTRDGGYLRTIAVDGIVLDGPDAVTPVEDDATALRRAAQKHGRKAILLVSNYSNDLQDFDEQVAHDMLTSPDDRAAVVAGLVREARRFDGVQIDLESLQERDRDGLTAFTTELRDALPATAQLSMAFMASTDAAGYRERGYDLEALGTVLDRLVLMAYDQHGSWSRPGPVGSLPWVRRELGYFAKVLPDARIDLGVAGYAYQWKGRKDVLTVPQARKAAGSKARWSRTAAEWHATFSSGRTIWWSDRRSLRAREKVAAAAGIHGVAIWEIGESGRLR